MPYVISHEETRLILEEISKQIPVLVGGILAIAGGVGSQIVMHVLTVRREASKVRKERLESLVKTVYAHAQWLDAKRDAMIFRKEDHDTPAPIDEARMLQALYFPQLAGELIAIQQAAIPMISFIHQQKINHMKDQKQFIEEWNDKPYQDAYKNLLTAINALIVKAREVLAK